ncbi:uncharacterized protein SPAPADRAFT_50498 [Spathaspora passalidarum NRRL Y-27907]|uniref:Uncharacterized protein n=1 Tax=Spathaspora passalidarum (strain NRRL Y-27907 / 11-Y1) TaxID=619300 RepID=G3AKU1_SPAPN|nr:uncharacterized protein SPAPADRAFT_50498 [Spathaspora passalidarum NRRL Y-27907]EGW33643.1 hypothetical protein SPAPADRAFT_50498 [Spathaspora passalidarum NRRL Y-27907]
MANTQPQQEQFILIIAALVLPPLAIFLAKKYSIWNKEFLVSVLLTMFGHIPGAIFTLYYLWYIEFPQSRQGGYNRLPDDDESRLGQQQEGFYEDHDHHQESRVGAQEEGFYEPEQLKQPQPQQQGNAGSSSSRPQNDALAGDLPAYEDIVQPLQAPAVDVKGSSDNKIQR